MIFDIHIIFSSQSIWEVFLSCLILISPASHLRNPALQDSYRIFNQDCAKQEAVCILQNSLPVFCVLFYFSFSYPQSYQHSGTHCYPGYPHRHISNISGFHTIFPLCCICFPIPFFVCCSTI